MQAGGRGFESPHLHKSRCMKILFFLLINTGLLNSGFSNSMQHSMPNTCVSFSFSTDQGITASFFKNFVHSHNLIINAGIIQTGINKTKISNGFNTFINPDITYKTSFKSINFSFHFNMVYPVGISYENIFITNKHWRLK